MKAAGARWADNGKYRDRSRNGECKIGCAAGGGPVLGPALPRGIDLQA